MDIITLAWPIVITNGGGVTVVAVLTCTDNYDTPPDPDVGLVPAVPPDFEQDPDILLVYSDTWLLKKCDFVVSYRFIRNPFYSFKYYSSLRKEELCGINLSG